MLQQHPRFPLTVISALVSHPTLDRACELHQALRLLRIRRGKRETGRTPEGNRCLRYPGFTYKERRRRRRRQDGEERGERRGFTEREINASMDLVVLIFKMIDHSFSCCSAEVTVPPDMISSSHVDGTTCSAERMTLGVIQLTA